MKKTGLAVLAVFAATALFTACAGNQKAPETAAAQQAASAPETAAAKQEAAAPETTAAPETAEAPETTAAETGKAETEAPDPFAGRDLPEFVFDGSNPYKQPIFDYFKENQLKDFEEFDVLIPGMDFLREDDTDPEDIKVWFRSWIGNYCLRGTTLMSQNGGEFSGCAHLKKAGSGYEVAEMDMVLDGSDSGPSTERIFGADKELMEAYKAASEDRLDCLVSAMHEYSESTGIAIDAFSEYGWDPVQVNMDEEFDLSYPDILGEWAAEGGDVTMNVLAKESGNVYDLTITKKGNGEETTYDIYAEYEMSTDSLYYWDCWENDDSAQETGILEILPSNEIHWITESGDEALFIRQ